METLVLLLSLLTVKEGYYQQDGKCFRDVDAPFTLSSNVSIAFTLQTPFYKYVRPCPSCKGEWVMEVPPPPPPPQPTEVACKEMWQWPSLQRQSSLTDLASTVHITQGSILTHNGTGTFRVVQPAETEIKARPKRWRFWRQ